MKIVLENEIEKKIWDIMLSIHYKWEKNYGERVRDYIDFAFNNIYKEDVSKMVEEEATSRLHQVWNQEDLKVPSMSEDEFIKMCLNNNSDLTADELSEEYHIIVDHINDDIEDFKREVWDEIEEMRNFFNAPENVQVEYTGPGEVNWCS